MGQTKDLAGADAIAKIRELADGKIAMLCTFTNDHAMDTRPMATQQVGDDGTIWMFSSKDSTENRQIVANPAVQLIYANPSKNEYLSLDATASISRDQALIDQLWNPIAKAWFPEGKDDPNLTLITITVTGGRYWDTQHGKMIQLAKIAFGAVTGKPTDDGVKGNLRV
jgi:general stress protein 26